MAARAARLAAAMAAAAAAGGAAPAAPPDTAADEVGGQEACPERLSADVFSRYVCVHASKHRQRIRVSGEARAVGAASQRRCCACFLCSLRVAWLTHARARPNFADTRAPAHTPVAAP